MSRDEAIVVMVDENAIYVLADEGKSIKSSKIDSQRFED